jgi:hypothetical protein
MSHVLTWPSSTMQLLGTSELHFEEPTKHPPYRELYIGKETIRAVPYIVHFSVLSM